MKLVTFEVRTPLGPFRRIGALLDGELGPQAQIADLTSSYAARLLEEGEPRATEAASALLPPDMLAYLDGGDPSRHRALEALEFARTHAAAGGPRGETLVFSSSEVRVISPLPRPRSIRDYSTYEEHMSTRRREKPPVFYHAATCYKGNPEAVCGPDGPILYPAYTDWLDPELELACVVHKRGRNLSIAEAAEHIGGYTILIDASARDLGPKDYLGPYKMKDFCTLLGPCLVTPDEFSEEHGRCGIRVNGETWFEGDIGHRRHHYFPELIAYASDAEDVVPGDLLGSGTVGTGCSMDIGKWLQPGDVVEAWIEGIGTIRSAVVKEENERSYVRKGLPGRLAVPVPARDFIERFDEDARERLQAGADGPGPRLLS
ncbi:MAG: fumarylacetoacetate hydrolase family protein [bacterium]|jgi:2-keto-4-pentenoate hydratase/2-oxohepta-3-ene-1,7-dioic acid hydratase in catechol pathway|nr:fumarylacetoacetate hydrolase family protein [bacterium]